jgi:hypothetical protein
MNPLHPALLIMLIILRKQPHPEVPREARPRRTHGIFAALAALVLSTANAAAQHQHSAAPACADTGLSCATAATPAFAPDGSLWLAWAAGGRVMVGHSRDPGGTLEVAVAVNPEPERVDSGPDARPKIVVDDKNRIVVAYAVFQDDRYNGRVMVSRSVDGGASFTAPQPITGDATSQRFETLALDPADGNLFAAWLDKRNVAAAKAAGKTYPGGALAYSWSLDGGESFMPARIARDNVCECCRLGVAFLGPHRPAILFRNIFGDSTRDHALLAFQDRDATGPLHRVSVDDWEIDACPHHGPSVAIGGKGTIHAAWFTSGKARKGLFYARSSDDGGHFTAPLPIGDASRRPARPYLAASGDTVRLVWKEFDGETTGVWLMVSGNDGESWSEPNEIATTADASDHPLLVTHGRQTFLSWLTHAEGFRLIPLGNSP